MASRCFAGILLLCTLVPAEAQMSGGHAQCTIRVDVVFAVGGGPAPHLRVRLLKGMTGSPVGELLTNSSGTAEFAGLESGQYHAVVSGENIESAESGTIEVSDWSVFMSQTVAVRTTTKPGGASNPSMAAAISAADLNVPPKAGKEYDHGNEEMTHKNWSKAIEHFNKAIEIYPSFSAAYNNLGVSYGRLGQREQQRQALLKAISLNERCAPALVNLAYMNMEDKHLSEAGGLLSKAVALDPNNVEALSYLAQVDVDQGQFDLAIAAVHKVHSLPHQQFGIVHYTAARAYENEGRIADAIAELQLFLQEAPQSPRAETARKAIAALQNEPK
jgi:outer membrane protein assembly factor BamD (BamD/ComL family)